ncbi:MAG: PhzF family phenazine biosynthesis protein [Solirubrobacterales bacterium]|nr:PhzF family phenazine biosynthesis protein [Solirubrobacterales bacterium]
MPEILRYSAFTQTADGGNPAGVVLDASGLDSGAMRAIAKELGYSETAFVTARDGDTRTVRYFSPESEVPFCGHATIATAVAIADAHGPVDLLLDTAAGRVPVRVVPGPGGRPVATLTSVPTRVWDAPAEDVAEALAALCWDAGDLDPALPPRYAHAGAGHLILSAATRQRLADLDYDFDRLRALLAARDCVTLALVHRRPGGDGQTFDARNPFPTGGVVEDPATGAAAAAFGAYLRELALVGVPARVTIHQGEDMGCPSVLLVDIPAGADAGVDVSGTAVPIG